MAFDAERVSFFLNHAVDESAQQAVLRYHSFLEEAFSNSADAMARWRLRFSKPVALAKIRAAEKRLGVRLPPSYVDFVTERGLYSGPGDYLNMLEPGDLGTLHDHLLPAYCAKNSKQLARNLGLDEAAIADLKNTIVFSTGQYEELLNVFQMHAAEPATGEAPIQTFDPQDGLSALPLPTGEASGREFDRHVRELLDFNIREVAKRLRSGN